MTEPVVLTDAEREAIGSLAQHIVEPGTRCPTCNRRVNKKKQDDSPKETREVRLRGPAGLVEDVEENFDILQEYVGIDPYSYPRLRLADALIALGARHREELKAHFEGGDGR